MSDSGAAEALAGLPHFAGLAEHSRGALVQQAMMMRVPRGTMIFEQGEIPTAQVILLDGAVHLLGRIGEGPEMLIEAIWPPDPLLPAAVLEDAPYLMRARAVQDCRLLLIPAAAMRAVVAAEPAVALAFLSCLARQFRRMTRQVKDLKLRSTTERLACYLLALDELQKADVVTLPYDKGTIAAELGMARETLSRSFSVLGQAIEVHGAQIRIINKNKLLDYCRRG